MQHICYKIVKLQQKRRRMCARAYWKYSCLEQKIQNTFEKGIMTTKRDSGQKHILSHLKYLRRYF